MLRGIMGGLELSELTVFWKFIDSFLENYCQTIVGLKRQNPVRRVRKPHPGRGVPRRRPM